jgi:hypothetical protein
MTVLKPASGRDFSGSRSWTTARKNPTDGDDIKSQRKKCLAHIAPAAESFFELPKLGRGKTYRLTVK